MELKYIVAAVSAVIATSAFAGGDRVYQRSEGSSGYMTRSQSENSAAVVRQVELQLNRLGYDAGPADGAFDSQTQESLRQFQQAENLSPTGEIDRPTLAALGIVSSENIARAPAPGTWSTDSSSTAGVGNATNSTSSRPWGSHAPQD